MRKPTVKNKYKIKVSDLNKLVLLDKDKLCEPLFWRNNIINAWCISDGTYSEMDTYWIGVYDEDAESYKGKIKVYFTSYEGMCDYKFRKFYCYDEISCEDDLRVQEMFLEKLNYLLDNNIFAIKKSS